MRLNVLELEAVGLKTDPGILLLRDIDRHRLHPFGLKDDPRLTRPVGVVGRYLEVKPILRYAACQVAIVVHQPRSLALDAVRIVEIRRYDQRHVAALGSESELAL